MSLKVKFSELKGFLFENRNIKQTILKNSFWLTFGNLAGRIIKAGLIIYAARVLGTAGYGVFSYAVSLAGFFSLFADIGLTGIMTRETAKNPALVKNYVSTGLVIKLILIVISIVLVVFGAPLFTKIPAALPLLPLAALLIIFDTLRDFSFSITRAFEKMQFEAVINICTSLAITILGIVALLMKSSAQNLMVSYTIGSAFGTILSFWFLREHFGKFWRYFNKKMVAQLLKEAWPFALLGFLGSIMLNTDTIMLGWFKSAEVIGIYSAAQRPIQLIYLMPSVLVVSLFPLFAKLAKHDDMKFRSVFEKSMTIVLGMAIPLVLGGSILASQIIKLLFGNQFLAATPIMQILLVTMILYFPGSLVANAVFAYGAQKNFIRSLALGAIGNAFFNLLLIPPFGAVGSAIATVVAQLLSNGSNWLKLQQINGFKILPYLKKISAAAILMAVATLAFKILGLNVLVNVFFSIIIYAAILYKLKEPLLDKSFVLSIFK